MCIKSVSLQEVDPCEDVSDEDIRMAIQNATGPRSALFVPEVRRACLCFACVIETYS
jgi:hypothetical protein